MASRESGYSIAESCVRAGVSRQSGTRWEKDRKPGDNAGEPVGREEAVGIYSRAVRDSPSNTLGQVIGGYVRFMGMESGPEAGVLTWPSTTIAYIDEEHRRLVARQHACSQNPIPTPGSPKPESIDFIESPAQNLQKKGGATGGPSEEGSDGG